MTSPYKPSPLSFNSPRTSPFKRPSSPGSPTTVIGRPSTPPRQAAVSPMASPSKLKQSFTASEEDEDTLDMQQSASALRSPAEPLRTMLRAQTEPPASFPSPSKADASLPFSISSAARSPNRFSSPGSPLSPRAQQADHLSKLPPALLHSMRESFSVLDSNSTGSIDATSVAETLQSLGLADDAQSQHRQLSQLFPATGQPHQHQLSLPQYLNQLANLLVGLSPPQELLNAFSAFDDDDSGQVDVAALTDALLTTAPDAGERALTPRDVERALDGFTGRRILGKHHAIGGGIGITGARGWKEPTMAGGDVFRYQEFVANLTGGSDGNNAQAPPAAVHAA